MSLENKFIDHFAILVSTEITKDKELRNFCIQQLINILEGEKVWPVDYLYEIMNLIMEHERLASEYYETVVHEIECYKDGHMSKECRKRLFLSLAHTQIYLDQISDLVFIRTDWGYVTHPRAVEMMYLAYNLILANLKVKENCFMRDVYLALCIRVEEPRSVLLLAQKLVTAMNVFIMKREKINC